MAAGVGPGEAGSAEPGFTALSNGFAPSCQEPVLPEAQYQQALAVLRNARNALERTPSMTANLDEEKIRDLLLVLLNAQFEGAAAWLCRYRLERRSCTGLGPHGLLRVPSRTAGHTASREWRWLSCHALSAVVSHHPAAITHSNYFRI
jgi:hypothetical protein